MQLLKGLGGLRIFDVLVVRLNDNQSFTKNYMSGLLTNVEKSLRVSKPRIGTKCVLS